MERAGGQGKGREWSMDDIWVEALQVFQILGKEESPVEISDSQICMWDTTVFIMQDIFWISCKKSYVKKELQAQRLT